MHVEKFGYGGARSVADLLGEIREGLCRVVSSPQLLRVSEIVSVVLIAGSMTLVRTHEQVGPGATQDQRSFATVHR